MSGDKYRRALPERLAEEARQWVTGERDPREWEDAPERVPRGGKSTAISVRFPTKMLLVLKEFARREGIGYQVLMKRWLDDRIQKELVSIQRPHHRPLHGVVVRSESSVLRTVDVLSDTARTDVVSRVASLALARRDPPEEP